MESSQGVDVNYVMSCMLPGHVSQGPFHSYWVRRHLVTRARNDVLHTKQREVIFDLPRHPPPKVQDMTTSNHKCAALATRSLLSLFILSSTFLWGVEVWNNPTLLSHPKFLTSQRCGSVEESDEVGIVSPRFPSHDPSVILYLVLHFSEVWKCGKVWQSKDNVTLFPWSGTPCHSLLSSTLLRGVKVWKSLPSYFSPGHETSVILYLVPHLSEVWKCGKVWQSKDNVTLFPWSRTLCHSLLSSTLLRGVEVWNSPTK